MVHSMHTPVPTGAGHGAPAPGTHTPASAPAPHAPAHAPTHAPSTPAAPANPNPTAGEEGLYVHELCHEALHVVTGGKHLSFMKGAKLHVSIAALDRDVLHATPHEHSTEGSIPFDAYFFVAVKDTEENIAYEVHQAQSSRFNGNAPTIHAQAIEFGKQKKIVHFVALAKRTLVSNFYNKLCGDRYIALLVGGTLREDTAYLSLLVSKAADRVVTILSSVDKQELALSKEQVLQAIQTPFNFSAFKDDH